MNREHMNAGLVRYLNGHFASGSGMVSRQSQENRTYLSGFEWSIGLDHFKRKEIFSFL
jgi:hypothetical protein